MIGHFVVDPFYAALSPQCEIGTSDFSQIVRLSAPGKSPCVLVYPPHALDPDLEQVERFCGEVKDILWETEGTVLVTVVVVLASA